MKQDNKQKWFMEAQKWFMEVELNLEIHDIGCQGLITIAADRKREILRDLNSFNPKPFSCEHCGAVLKIFYNLNPSAVPFEVQIEADEIMKKVIDPILEKTSGKSESVRLVLKEFKIHQEVILIKESY
jgi:hypothetical protein